MMSFIKLFLIIVLLSSCSTRTLEKIEIEKELRQVNEEVVKGKNISLVFFNHSKDKALLKEAKKEILNSFQKQFRDLGFYVVPEVKKGHLLIKIHMEDSDSSDGLKISLYGDVQEWGKRARPFFQFTNLKYLPNKEFLFKLSEIPIRTYDSYQKRINEENIYVNEEKDPGCFFTIGFLAKCKNESCIVNRVTNIGKKSGVIVGDQLLSFNGFGASYVINNAAYDFVYSGHESVKLKIKRDKEELLLDSPLQEYCIDQDFFKTIKI